MHLSRLALTDFRSYAGVDLSLEPGVSTLIGANGQGKTNVVEAVGYLATLGSHRVASDAPLVRHGADRAILRGAVTSAERDSLVEIEINPGRANRARLNRSPVSRPRQVLGGEQHRAQHAEDLTWPGHGCAVQPGAVRPAGVDLDLDQAVALGGGHRAAQDGPLRPVPDQGSVAGNPVAAQRGQVADRLDHVRLALPVRADERAHPGLQAQVHRGVGPEISKGEAAQVHNAEVTSGYRHQVKADAVVPQWAGSAGVDVFRRKCQPAPSGGRLISAPRR